jgi:PIN domain nuclease of toxin-antitoxin system
MRFLLDTCAVIFFAEATGDLSREATDSLQAPDSEVFVSAVSIGELACAVERGRLKVKQHWRVWWKEALRRNGWPCLPVTAEIVEEAYSLSEPIHRDPADRLLIATARIERLTLVTTDAKLLGSPHLRTLR